MSDAPKRPRPRRWLARLIVLAGASVIAFAVAEIGTRIFLAESVVLYPRNHTDAQYGPYHLRRLRPSTTFRHTSIDGSWLFTTNAQGFRDARNYRTERTPGTMRVLCLGDSQTQGFEVRQSETYPKVIERRLGELGITAEVMNCGISGFGTAEQLAFIENAGFDYRPDVVVLGWFANDPDDNVKSGLFAVRDGVLVEAGREHAPAVKVLNFLNAVPPLRWLGEHSWFYSMAFNRAWELGKGGLSRERNAAVEFTTQAPLADGETSAYQDELSAKLLERLHAACAKRGIPLVILDIPKCIVPRQFQTSVPAGIAPVFPAQSEAFLSADAVLGSYRGTAELFVPHGQHHISETSHLLFGMAVAEWIAQRQKQ
jgi:GDSL-like Lipase/Acylhydrolase family